MITDMARTKGGTPGFKGISVEEAKRRERLAQQRRIEAFEKRKKITKRETLSLGWWVAASPILAL